MNPYLDVAGFKRGTMMPSSDVDLVEQVQPGFTAGRIAYRSGQINAAARKRYGDAGKLGNHIPFGQIPPALVASGTAPPGVLLVGRPVLGCIAIRIQILTAGALGVATCAWAPVWWDGAQDSQIEWFPLDATGNASNPSALVGGAGAGIVTGTYVKLGTTGLFAQFSPGTYSADNVYQADTPVPREVLSWLVSVVTPDVYMKRGSDPSDPGLKLFLDERDAALERLKQASDGKDGLLDLPISEDLGSAVTTGGVESYSETSPYTWTDREERRGREQDHGRDY